MSVRTAWLSFALTPARGPSRAQYPIPYDKARVLGQHADLRIVDPLHELERPVFGDVRPDKGAIVLVALINAVGANENLNATSKMMALEKS